MKLRSLTFAAAALFAVPALAQDPGAVTQPQQFVDMATVANMFEIELSKVALEKSAKPETKTFAQHMIDDHSKAGEEMKVAADAEGMKMPTALDEKHQKKVELLSGSSGDAFDQSYLAEQLIAHEEAVALFTGYSTNGAPGALKDFAAKTLPALKSHLEEVKTLTAAK